MTPSERTCRHCNRSFRPERVLTYDRRGRLSGYAESGTPWCSACLDAIQGDATPVPASDCWRVWRKSGQVVPVEDLETK